MSKVEQLEASMQELTEHILALHRERQSLTTRVQSLETELRVVRKRARMLIFALIHRLFQSQSPKGLIKNRKETKNRKEIAIPR